jgi:hypothetical protein
VAAHSVRGEEAQSISQTEARFGPSALTSFQPEFAPCESAKNITASFGGAVPQPFGTLLTSRQFS